MEAQSLPMILDAAQISNEDGDAKTAAAALFLGSDGMASATTDMIHTTMFLRNFIYELSDQLHEQNSRKANNILCFQVYPEPGLCQTRFMANLASW
jgi:hypothetical protein